LQNVVLRPVPSETDPDRWTVLAKHIPADAVDSIRSRVKGPVLIHGRPTSDKTWERIDVGDLVLLTHAGRVFQVGDVIYKGLNPELAEEVWPAARYNDGPWPRVFAVSSIRQLTISYADLNAVTGDAPAYVPQGFRVYDAKKGALVRAYVNNLLGLKSASPGQ
jgi:hypothetical protein